MKKRLNIIILQPTSPLRTHKHIEEAIKYFKKKKNVTQYSVVIFQKNLYGKIKISL